MDGEKGEQVRKEGDGDGEEEGGRRKGERD